MAKTLFTVDLNTGDVACIYDDKHLPLFEAIGGKLEVTRASEVDPDPDGGWIANLARSGGPVLRGFTRREDAIAAEVEWLTEHGLGDPGAVLGGTL